MRRGPRTEVRPCVLRSRADSRRASKAGDTAIIVTGAGTQPLLPAGENDGPIGAAVLARALVEGLDVIPVFVVEAHHAAPAAASSEAIGLPIRPLDLARDTRSAAALITAPRADEEIPGWASALCEQVAPSAIIAIERLGPNAAGIIHGSTGRAGWSPQVDLAPLFAEARARGVLSVGIGDAGNEIGFGRIIDTVRAVQPEGAVCRCPCGQGMATVVETDVLMVAAVSNWGAYAVEAALAHVLDNPVLPHRPDEARRVIASCLDAGGLEAVHCSRRWLVDGIDAEVSVSLVGVLNEMVKISLQRPAPGPIH